MARFFYEDSLGEYGSPADFINELTLDVTSASSTQVTLKDAEGDGFTFKGTGLTFDAFGNITGGMFTELKIFDSTGKSLISVDRFSFDAMTMVNTFNAVGLEAAVLLLISKRDLLVGSGVGDILFSGGGDDTIRGGGGADFINGFKGDDLLTGGNGADQFLFIGGGVDHILDFQDLGLASDDKIGVTGRMYRNMTTTETLTGVELDFGAKGTLIVDGWHLADIGRDDFILG